jgi:hypothetical protein
MNTQNKKQFEPVKLNFSKETVMVLNNVISNESYITKTESCNICVSAAGDPVCETLWLTLLRC